VSEYHLKVAAIDGGGLSCTSDIYVTVIDVNDNPPRFLQSHYVVTTMENSETTTLVVRVTAVDADLGINRRVTYSLYEKSEVSSHVKGTFAIDPTSGVLSLLRGLDRETQESYNLTLYATDQVGGQWG